MFAHETGGATGAQRAVRGALPNDDIAYILGMPLWDTRTPVSYTNDDRALCRVFMKYIANFVQSGYVTYSCLFTPAVIITHTF